MSGEVKAKYFYPTVLGKISDTKNNESARDFWLTRKIFIFNSRTYAESRSGSPPVVSSAKAFAKIGVELICIILNLMGLGFAVSGGAHSRNAAPEARLRGAAKFGVCLHHCTMFFDLLYAENPLGGRDFQIL